MHEQDWDITLDTGKVLGLLFLVVVISVGLFAFGYSFGRNTASAAAKRALAAQPVALNPVAVKPDAVADLKSDCSRNPEAGIPAPATGTPAPADGGPAPATGTPAPAAGAPAPAARARGAPDSSPPVSAPAATTARKTVASETPRPTPLAGSYVVQVAAVGKQQEAEALVAALRQRQYQVFIARQDSDKLFHVQVGPFGDRKDAAAIRTRLIADGYAAIVK